MIATNAFKQAVVGTYTTTDTVIELDSISNVEGDADYLPNGGFNLILYDGLFGNPADANNAGSYEILECTGVNYATNEITVLRGRENTDAITIGGGASWQVIYGATKALLEGFAQPFVNGSPTVFEDGTGGQRKVDLYYTYDFINGVWIRKVKDLSQEPTYITETIDEGLVPNDIVATYGVLKANQTGTIYFASGSMEVTVSGGRTLVDKWKPNTGDTVEFTGTDRPELIFDGQWKVCVEKGGTNVFRDSDPATDPAQGNRTAISFAENDWGIKFNGNDLNGKVIFGDNSVLREYYNVSGLDESPITASFLIKPDNGVEPTFGFGPSDIGDFRMGGGGTNLSDYIITEVSKGIFLVTRARAMGSFFDRVGMRKQTVNNSVGFEVTAIDVKLGSYPTLYIPTSGTAVTRTVPSLVIPDALNGLESGGTISGVCEMIRDDLGGAIGATSQWAFDTGGNSNSERSAFRFTIPNRFACQMFGNTGGWIIDSSPSISWNEYDNLKFAYIITFNSTTLELWFLKGSNIYKRSSAHELNSLTRKDVLIGDLFSGGRASSGKFEVPFKTDSVVRVGYADEEIKAEFERLTFGTSQYTKASDMTIVP